MALKAFKAGESERVTEAYLVKSVRKLGGLCLKFTSPQNKGVPDRLCLLPGGLIFFVEVKSEGIKPSSLQLAAHSAIEACGFKVFVVDTKTKVDKLMEEAAND